MLRALLALGLMLLSAEELRAAETNSAISPASLQNTNEQVFEVKGLVVAVMPEEKSVKIKHEEIPGYMDAMTMVFDVKDTNELAGIETGDPVSFRMVVSDTYGWIDQIRKTGPKKNNLPTTGPFRLVRDVEPLEIGDRLPEYHFTNQRGEIFSTEKFKGQVLAINFLFTRCPYPTFCPQTARNFAETQQALLKSPNTPTNWQLLSISFDPEFDRPAVLKRYAEAQHHDPGHWTFATGA
ncbi:MAG TPA: SCO family protein, partial [Candidatus Paceibacterota bacterium]|nr:SCO family protein [Candidatus Paceibacterota bacterium]